MRILLVSARAPEQARGGADRHAAELGAVLRSSGHEVHHHPVGEPVPRLLPGGAFAGSLSAGLPALHRALSLHRPQVVHFHSLLHLGPAAGWVARRQGALPFVTAHDLFSACARVHGTDRWGHWCAGPEGGSRCASCAGPHRLARPAFQLRNRAFQTGLAAFARVVAPSAFAADTLVRWGACGARPSILAPGIPAATAPGAAPAPGALGPGGDIVFLGDLRHEKGPDLLVEAARALRTTGRGLALWGCTPDAASTEQRRTWQAHLLRRAGEEGVAVRGPYGTADLDGILATAALVVVPSRVRETWGRTAAEALARGVPVVAARSGALGELVHDGVNGALFPPGDAGELARAVVRILDDPPLDRARWAPVPDVRSTAQRLLGWYGEALEARPG